MVCDADVFGDDGDSASCVVFSIGSNNNFRFEDAVLAETKCTVHTYDCFVTKFMRENTELHTLHPQVYTRTVTHTSILYLGA